MPVRLRIQHLNHSGSIVSTHLPVGGSLRWSYRSTDIGDIAYELPLSDTAITRDSFRPYYTDWRLQKDVDSAGWESIAAGIHTSVGLVTEADSVSIAGKDWAHWLEQPYWFELYDVQFTPGDIQDVLDESSGGWSYGGDGVWDTIAGTAFSGPSGATQEYLIQYLIDNTWRPDNQYVPISPVFNGVGWTELISYVIMFEDETDVLQHINTVAKLGDPYGFDWYMNWDKTMQFFGPRRTLAGSPSPIWTITEADVDNPADLIDWANNGPLATHVVGLGPGNPAIWWMQQDAESIDLYRHWYKLVRIGDAYIKGADQVEFATKGLQYIHPQKDLKLTIRPEDLDPDEAFKNHIGDVIRVVWDFPPYHQIAAFFWIAEQQFHGDEAGNWKCDLGLQQIYE